MLSCWEADPSARPRFSDLADTLARIVRGIGAIEETDIDNAAAGAGAAAYLEVVATEAPVSNDYTAPVALAVPELGSRSALETGLAVTDYGATYNLATPEAANDNERGYTLPTALATPEIGSRATGAGVGGVGVPGYDMPAGYNEDGEAQVTEYSLATQEGGGRDDRRHSGNTVVGSPGRLAARATATAAAAAPVAVAAVTVAAASLPPRPRYAAPPPPAARKVAVAPSPPRATLPSARRVAAPPRLRPKVATTAPVSPPPTLSHSPAVAGSGAEQAAVRAHVRPTPARRASAAPSAAAVAATALVAATPVPKARRRSAAATAAMSGEDVWAAAIETVGGVVDGLLPALQASALLKETKLTNDALKLIWNKAKTDDGAVPRNMMSQQEFVAAYTLAVASGGHPIQAVTDM